MSLWSLLLVACGGPELSDPLGVAQTEVHTELVSKHVADEEPLVLTLSAHWAEGWTPQLGTELPPIEGLTSTLVDARSLDGERASTVQTWELRGDSGSHVIPGFSITFIGDDGAERVVETAALYADIGAPGPGSELAPMLLAPVPEPVPWWPFALAGGLLLAGAGGFWWRRRRAGGEPLPPPLAPDVIALRTWERLQADRTLDDHARAVQLSGLFRAYLEAVLPVPATTATSREILDALDLAQGLHQQTRRLLTATDLIKFARKGGGVDLFDALDADLRAVLAATRPVSEPVEGES